MKIAVAVFAYNRPNHLERLLTSLRLNDDFPDFSVYIFIDGPKSGEKRINYESVIRVGEEFSRKNENVFLEVSDSNLGLRNSITTRLSELFSRFDAVITVEDDLLVATDFLKFMKFSLLNFVHDERIGSISGYKEGFYPFYLQSDLVAARRQCCWGWATWKDRWDAIDWNDPVPTSRQFRENLDLLRTIGADLPEMYLLQSEKRIDSWSITFDANAARLHWRCIQPRRNLVINAGVDGSGTHSKLSNPMLILPKIPDGKFTKQMNRYSISFAYDYLLMLLHSSFARKTRRNFNRLSILFLRILSG